MIDYAKTRAIQEFRFIRPAEARKDRTKGRRRHVGLADLIGALAAGLASLGLRSRDGRTRPASPAY